MAQERRQRADDAVGLAPPGPAELRVRITDLAEQVRRLAVAHGHGGTPEADATTGPLATDVIAMAERAAEEIRENARREAARVQLGRAHDSSEAVGALLGAVKRQRQTVAVLAAEVERLDQSAELLRTQVRLLGNELGRIDELLRAAIAPAA